MIKCPKCGVNIDHLNIYGIRPVAACLYDDGTETDQNCDGSIEEERYECPECSISLAHSREDAMDVLSGMVVIKLRKMDWPLLVHQKEKLVWLADRETEKDAEDAIMGIIHLVDEVQDQSAKQIGEFNVFGYPFSNK